MRKWLTAIVLFILTGLHGVTAQCAMCRATLENNVSNGKIGIAAAINFGILYLFIMPYVGALLLGYFWYKRSKAERLKRHRA